MSLATQMDLARFASTASSDSDSSRASLGSGSGGAWLPSSTWLGRLLVRVIVVACYALEVAVVIPTAWAELQFISVGAGGPWPFALRLAVSIMRLLPILRVLTKFTCHLARGPVLWRCCVPQALRWRIQSCTGHLLSAELRWGVAITLDMWYLLSTPLNVGLREVGLGILLVANIFLCFSDTVALLVILSAKPQPQGEVYPESSFHRARHVKLHTAEEGLERTCAICLCDFEEEESAVQLPCNHVFHCDCITTWLQRSRHCPMRCPELVLPPRRLQRSGAVPQGEAQPEPIGNPMTETEQLVSVVPSLPGQVGSEG